MSDADSKRRPKNTATGQRPPRFTAGDRPLPQPPQLKKMVDLVDDLPELRPRRARAVTQPGAARSGPRLVLSEEIDSSQPNRSTPRVNTVADLDRAKMLGARPVPLRSTFPVAESRRSLLDLFWGSPWLVLLAGVACLVIYLLASAPARVTLSSYVNWGGARQAKNVALAPVAPGEHSLIGPPTISADDVEAVLRQYNSPAVGTGPVWIALGEKYGIDPAYALAFFVHESTAGTNPGWAGLKPGGESTHNIGNIICAGYSSCYQGHRDYPSWEDGIEAWYRLIQKEYVAGRGVSSVEQILPIYCPTGDGCLPDEYIQIVNTMIEQWRSGKLH